MSKKPTVYLAGAMSGLKRSVIESWREKMQNDIQEYGWNVINPAEHIVWIDDYMFADDADDGMTYDLWSIRNSDLVIVDLVHQGSIGTAMELAIAYEHNIPIIGFINEEIEIGMIHPWIENVCMAILCDMEDCYQYFVNHFANTL